MIRILLFVMLAAGSQAQVVKDFVPVTQDMLLSPSPDDWLMYSRTYGAQRYSPEHPSGRFRELFFAAGIGGAAGISTRPGEYEGSAVADSFTKAGRWTRGLIGVPLLRQRGRVFTF